MTNLDRVIGFQMHRRSMTQASLAARVGVSPSTMFRWLAGKGHPPVQKCQLIASALGLNEKDVIQAASLDADKYHPKKVSTQVVESKSLKVDIVGATPIDYTQEETEQDQRHETELTPIIKNDGALQTIRLRTIAEMQGVACVYKVDTSNDYIELSDANGGTITGILDVDQIKSIISELQELLLIKHRAV